MIELTVGRIVLFHPHIEQGGDPNGQPHAAIVTHVHNARLVNLAVFNENGSLYSRQHVDLLQDDDAGKPAGDYAEWMVYQKGQAAKAESLEKKLAEGEATKPPPFDPPQVAPANPAPLPANPPQSEAAPVNPAPANPEPMGAPEQPVSEILPETPATGAATAQ